MSLKENNKIQRELILDSGLEPVKWIKIYAKKFSQIRIEGVSEITEIKDKLYF